MEIQNFTTMERGEKFRRLEELLKLLEELASKAPKSEVVKITLEDVEFDEQGRLIIKNPEITNKIRKWLEENKELSLGEGMNFICLNIGCP